MTKTKKKRDKPRMADGRYRYDKMDRPCVCGHTLGAHAAERNKMTKARAEAAGHPELAGKTFQHCMANECLEPWSSCSTPRESRRGGLPSRPS